MTDLDCGQAAEQIGAFVDDDLPQEARRRLEAHLMRCPSCAWEAQSLQITRARLRDGIGEVVASDAFRARVLGRLFKDNPHVSPSPAESGDGAAANGQAELRLPIAWE